MIRSMNARQRMLRSSRNARNSPMIPRSFQSWLFTASPSHFDWRRLACICAVGLILVTGAAGLGAAQAQADVGTAVSATEGQPFSGRVVSTSCAFSAASIDWGDGTAASPGRDAGSPPGVAGDHTYAEEGSYTGTVTYSTDCVRFAVVHFQATVADAQLTAAGRDVAGIRGQRLSGTVGHFGDADPSGAAADFSATVHWGDGTTSAGSVTSAAGGGFDASSAHTYSAGGTFTVSTSIVDSGGSTATATAHAAIAGTSTTTTTTSGSPPAPPRLIRVTPLLAPIAGAPIVLTAVADKKVRTIEWNLSGDSRPEITCSGAQTAVTFRAPAGRRSITVRAFGSGGAGPSLAASLVVKPSSPRTRAAQLVTRRVVKALSRKAPVYACTAPGDFTVVPGRAHGIAHLTDHIALRTCVTPRTVVAGGLQFEGCLRRVTSVDQIPAAESGIIFPFGTHFHIHTDFRSLDLSLGLSDAYITEGAVKVNGLTLRPGPNASIIVSSQIDAIVSSDARMSVGNIELQNARSFLMDIYPRSGRIPLGSFARAGGGLGTIAGFALGGNVDVALDGSGDNFGLSIHVHLSLPSFLQVGGVSAQGDVTLRATNADGLVIDKLRIGPIDAEIAGLGIQALQLDYARANQEWAGQGKACVIDGACLDMIPPNGGVLIRNGGLVRAAASLEFPAPGIELFAGVALNRIGFGLGLDPTRILANANLTAEGVLEIDGHLVVAFPSEASPFILDRAEVGNAFPANYYDRSYPRPTFAIAADAFFDLPLAGRTRLGGAYLLYQAPGYVGFGGGVDANFLGIVSLTGRVDGEFNFGNGRFSVKGEIRACLADIICAGAIAAISDRGAGGCVHIETFLGDINVGGGVGFSPFHIYLWPFDGCRWSPFVDTHVLSTRHAQAAIAATPLSVIIRRGDRSRAIRLDGVGGAPSVRVRIPGGQVLDSSSGSGLALSRSVRILRSPKLGTTVVGLVKPVPGTYTVEILPGSPAVRLISQASDQAPARVRASVHGKGASRTLVYAISRRVSQRVTFLEQARGGTRTIGTITGGGHGHLSFTPAPGRDRRRVIAQFELAGLAAETRTVASFTPPSPRLGRPAHLRIVRRGHRVQVSWRPVPGATRYELVTRLASGERERRIRQPHAILRGVQPFDGGRVSVRAAAPMRQGRPAVGSLRAVGRASTRLRRLPRPPRRH
jgi:hypothetical protein